VLLAAARALSQPLETLQPVSTRDSKIVRRWALPGDPRGVAVGADGTIYAGLAGPQAVVAIDPKTGAVKRRLVLDSAEIASTKELVTLRTSADRTRLYIANGSDESATILSLPNLAVLRELTMEGEAIRDVLPDPRGRHVYVLGRSVHVFDKDGSVELRTLPIEDPMAIAVSASGNVLAVVATEDYGNAKATSVALFDTTTFAELTRDPLQTEKAIEGAMFADDDRAFIAVARDSLFEMPIVARTPARLEPSAGNGPMRMTIDFGNLVNSDRVCLPERSGPQIATVVGTTLVYGERRCSASGTFSGSSRRVTPASIYGINAYAIAHDRASNTVVATDRAGFLTIYKMPQVRISK
jgi:hypothetical protein